MNMVSCVNFHYNHEAIVSNHVTLKPRTCSYMYILPEEIWTKYYSQSHGAHFVIFYRER